jgi:hypothetical protein
MGMRGHRFFGAFCSAVAVGLIAGCAGPAAPGTLNGEPVTQGSEESGLIVVSSQASSGKSLVITKSVLPSAGYVVAYADGAGAPGARLGQTDLLDSGTHQNVTVSLDTPVKDGAVVHIMLHAEDNKNSSFDFPEHDAPMTVKGAVIEATITVRVS